MVWKEIFGETISEEELLVVLSYRLNIHNKPKDVLEVWSVEGPVPDDGISPAFLIQSKSSSLAFVHVHKPLSKLHPAVLKKMYLGHYVFLNRMTLPLM